MVMVSPSAALVIAVWRVARVETGVWACAAIVRIIVRTMINMIKGFS
jgi:hypothetical protein